MTHDTAMGVAVIGRYAKGVGACVAGVALLAGCGNDGTSGPPSKEATTVASSPASAPQELAIPERVNVCQPGMVDTALTIDDVPTWPGPAPSEFIDQKSPSGLCGTLTGPEAQVVYEAAVKHPAALLEEGHFERGEGVSDTPDALWASEGVIAWLVVEPQW